MKYLFYAGSSILMPHMGVLMNEALDLNDENEVYWVWCNGYYQSCVSNMEANNLICKHCKKRAKRLMNRYLKDTNINILPLFDGLIHYEHSDYLFDCIDKLKQFSKDGCSLGYSIASTYISLTRNSILQFTEKHIAYYSFLVNCAIERLLNFEKIVIEKKPDCIVVFNARLFDTAICVEIAKKYGVNYCIKEVLDGPRTGKPYKIESYFNHTVFDINYKKKLIDDSWEKSNLTDETKTMIGSNFYIQKKRGVNVVDKSYISGQTVGLLPSNWDENKKNIVIFNSSDDELASIGVDYDSFSLYKSQYIGIESLLNEFEDKPQYHFYLRMHPNLGGLNNEFVKSLLELGHRYKNLTVIAPQEKVSTYSILDNAEKVVTFGSSVGIEAVYWNKPSILLSASEYYFLDTCYIPNSEEDFFEMIRSELPVKNNVGAIKYAFFLLDREVRCHDSKYVDLSFRKKKIFGKDVYVFSYDQLFGSPLLSRVISLFQRKVLSLAVKRKWAIPDEVLMDNI